MLGGVCCGAPVSLRIWGCRAHLSVCVCISECVWWYTHMQSVTDFGGCLCFDVHIYESVSMCIYCMCVCVGKQYPHIRGFCVWRGLSVISHKVLSPGSTSQVSPNPRPSPLCLPSPLPTPTPAA